MNRQTQLQLIDDIPAGQERDYLPGMGKDWQMPLYDLLALVAGIGKHQRRLVELADLSAGQRLLDVGCGTGNLLQRIARTTPGLDLAGLDPDRWALERAASKLRRARARATLIRGYADHLPFDDASLDRVVSTMALHHLGAEDREGFAAEAFRVLRPGGVVAIMDFGGSHQNEASHDHGHAHGRPRHGGVASRAMEQIPDDTLVRLLGQAGFSDASEVDRRDSRMGTLLYLRATRRR